MSRRHRVRTRQQAANPEMQADRALRRIARFSPPSTWHPALQARYIAMQERRAARKVGGA